MVKPELKRQQNLELDPNRTQQPDPVISNSVQRDKIKAKCEGRGSPRPLNRPYSVPLDLITSGSTSHLKPSVLQRYKDVEGFKEKAEKWKVRQSEGEPTDESSPEIRRRDKRNEFR